MARKFLTPIDLNKLELRNAVIQNLGTEPASPAEGQIYYDTASDRLRIYTGGSWSDVGAITSISGTENEIVVSASVGSVTVSLPATINADTTGNAATATALATGRSIGLYGDVSGSVSFNGSADVVINAQIQPNSVALGTDTSGDYVASVTGTANEISVTGSGEGAAVTVGLPTNVQVANDLTVGGNLTVSGSVVYLNVENLNVEDNIITLNYGATGAPVLNAGIEVERGDSSNVSLLWNESADGWSLTNDGSNYYYIARKYSSVIGNGNDTSITITHNLGTRGIQVQVYKNSADYETVEVDVERTTVDTVTLKFAVAPTNNEYVAVIVG